MATVDTEASVDLDRTAAASTVPSNEPRAGTMIGRYVVVEVAGQGAMGRVLRAYDPKLRREVALKVVHARRSESRAEARLVREAHALARLNHPNVVAVYDAEATAEGVAIAMEYVEGRTLRAWLAERRRAWPEIVEIGLAIAAGLTAAHAAGLVHRDVKPDNVLVGNDERVRVTDFGLARELAGPSLSPHASDDGAFDSDDGLLTETGALVGTPAYMAPEQHAGAIADARADQYALCTVLYEALHGERPFAAKDRVTLELAKRDGPPARPPTPIPGWLHDAIARGLAADPDRRWPSVDALARALRVGRQRGRRRWLLLPAAGLLAFGLVSVEMRDRRRAAAVEACIEAGAEIESVWNDDVRANVRDAILQSGIAHAEHTAANAMPYLDAYALAWTETRKAVCLDATVHARPEWNADVLDRAVWCLDDRQMRLSALVGQLARVDGAVATRAVQAAASLERVQPCRDRELLLRLPSPPSDDREAVQAVRAEQARVRALLNTGAAAESLTLARANLDRASELGWPPLVAATRFDVGWALLENGKYAESERELQEAYFEAARAGVASVASDAADGLVYVVGDSLARPIEGLRWSAHAEIWIAQLPESSRLREAWLLNGRGVVHMTKGAYAEASALFEEALAIFETVFGPMHPQVAGTLANLARTHLGLGEIEKSEAEHRRALAMLEEILGPDHPLVGQALVNLGALHAAKDEHAEAAALYERALAVLEATLGPDHPSVGTALLDLGSAYVKLGENARSLAAFERALRILQRSVGADHRVMGVLYQNLGASHSEMGDDAKARIELEQAIAIKAKAYGADHPSTALSEASLAHLYLGEGDHATAKPMFEHALASVEAAYGRDHPQLGLPLTALSQIAAAEGRWDDAIALAERGLAVRTSTGAIASDIAYSKFTLAVARTRDGEPTAETRSLAEEARTAFATARYDNMVTRVDAWLRGG